MKKCIVVLLTIELLYGCGNNSGVDNRVVYLEGYRFIYTGSVDEGNCDRVIVYVRGNMDTVLYKPVEIPNDMQTIGTSFRGRLEVLDIGHACKDGWNHWPDPLTLDMKLAYILDWEYIQ